MFGKKVESTFKGRKSQKKKRKRRRSKCAFGKSLKIKLLPKNIF
jgi:hypothetical protein